MIEQRAETAFSILMAGFVVILVLTNIIGVKLFLAFPEWLPNGFFGEPITLTTGILTYPITFLVTDIVCEVYGRRRANLMVFTGFVMSLLSLVLIQIALAVPGSPVWPSGNPNYATVEAMQQAYDSVFTLPGILIFASMTAYLIAQLMDVRLFHFWKRVTRGKHLWLRNNGSTLISQVVDTSTVILVTYWIGGLTGVIDESRPVSGQLLMLMATGYLFKFSFALIDTIPFYLGSRWLKRYLRYDPITEKNLTEDESCQSSAAFSMDQSPATASTKTN